MKKISLSRLEGFLKARCDDLRAAGLDATEYRDYIIAMIFLKRVNDTFEKEQREYVLKLQKDYPDLSEEELRDEAEQNNSGVYEFYVPVEARWRVAALPRALQSEMSQQYSEAKGKLEERLSAVEKERYRRQFDEAERMLYWRGIVEEKRNVGAALSNALKAIEDSNGHLLAGVLSTIRFDEVDGKGERKLPDNILIALVNDFNTVTLTDDNFEFPDLLGAAYEYLLKYFAEDAGKKGGEFYTPAPVVELMGRILQPAKDAEICDPTVGSGGLLINMRNYVESRYGTTSDLTLYGQELSPHTYKMCKEAKGERKLIEKRLREIAKSKKAFAKAKEDVPAELLSEETEKTAALVPCDEKIAALEAQIARHEALKSEKDACAQDIRVIERRRDELVDEAREKISADEARRLILARWQRTLRETVAAYLENHLRGVIAAVENLYDKYTVTLGDILAERDAAAAKLDGFLAELGYGEAAR